MADLVFLLTEFGVDFVVRGESTPHMLLLFFQLAFVRLDYSTMLNAGGFSIDLDGELRNGASQLSALRIPSLRLFEMVIHGLQQLLTELCLLLAGLSMRCHLLVVLVEHPIVVIPQMTVILLIIPRVGNFVIGPSEG